MTKARRDEYLRHEQSGEEESFLGRESTVISVPTPIGKNGKPKIDNRGRRGLEDMMASFPDEITQSVYALERIAAAEDTIEKVLTLCSPEARAIILSKRPILRRYAPEE